MRTQNQVRTQNTGENPEPGENPKVKISSYIFDRAKISAEM